MSTPGDPHDPSLPSDFGSHTSGPDPDFELAAIFATAAAIREAEEAAKRRKPRRTARTNPGGTDPLPCSAASLRGLGGRSDGRDKEKT
jgi:hypothetical protein